MKAGISRWITRIFDFLGSSTNNERSTKRQSTSTKPHRNASHRNAKAKPAGKLVVKAKANPKACGQKIQTAQPFRAVEIYSREQCCDAASRIKGQKFLAQHAPQLPLGGCSNPGGCHCRYRHLTDRRAELRRDADHGLPNRSFSHDDRRNRRDRRRRQPVASAS